MKKKVNLKVTSKKAKAKELFKPKDLFGDDWDSIEEKEILESWMIRNYGIRCPDYEEDCSLCEAYRLYDKLVSNVKSKEEDMD
jgi:hypothetical protein